MGVVLSDDTLRTVLGRPGFGGSVGASAPRKGAGAVKVLSVDWEFERGILGQVTLDRVKAAKLHAEHPGSTVTELDARDLDHETLAALIEELP